MSNTDQVDVININLPEPVMSQEDAKVDIKNLELAFDPVVLPEMYDTDVEIQHTLSSEEKEIIDVTIAVSSNPTEGYSIIDKYVASKKGAIDPNIVARLKSQASTSLQLYEMMGGVRRRKNKTFKKHRMNRANVRRSSSRGSSRGGSASASANVLRSR
jgi:hypothetical protein